MLENKQDYSGQTISQLNNIRKGLLLEVKNLRQRQGDILDKLYQEVALEQDDIAENYFSSGNSSNGKFFSQRLENCMRAMVSYETTNEINNSYLLTGIFRS